MRRIAAQVALAVCCLLHNATAADDSRRVALNAFTTDENVWESMSVVGDFAGLVQAELKDEPGIEFVEREQLVTVTQELALNAAFSSNALVSSMRRARLNEADWLIDARFATANDDRELRIEIIDLAHADLLAERRVNFRKANAPLRELLADVKRIAHEVSEALHAAREREREVAGRPIVAVFFYPDSEVFQREFSNALKDSKVAGVPPRVLRFPRASESLEEAQLVLGGFAEDAEGKWSSIADAYVTGSLRRKESGMIDGLPVLDAEKPDISVTVWNVANEPREFVEGSGKTTRPEFESAVAGQAHRLAARVAQSIVDRRATALEEPQRRRISAALLSSVDELENGRMYNERYADSPEGRRHFFNVIQTLEAACFFDPHDRAAAESLTQLRWSRSLQNQMRNSFVFLLERSEAWGRFVETFGLFELGGNGSERTPKRGQIKLRWGRELHSVGEEFIKSAWEVANEAVIGNKEDFGYPKGVPKEEQAQWAHELTLEVARRAILRSRNKSPTFECDGLYTIFDGGPYAFRLRDAKKRLEALYAVWPRLSAGEQRSIANDSRGLFGLRQLIARTFVEVGKPGGEKDLFDGIPVQSAATPQRNSPMRPPSAFFPSPRMLDEMSRLFRMRPIAAVPKPLKPQIEKLEATDRAQLYRIRQMITLGGRIWLISDGPEQTSVESPGKSLSEELRPARQTATRLFSYEPGSQTIERVAAVRQFTPVGLFPHRGQLWMGLGRGGVAMLDPATGALRRYGPDDGLNVESAYRLAFAGERIFVTANYSDMFAWDSNAQRWIPWKAEYRLSRSYGEALRWPCGLGPWLFLSGGAVGICDTRSATWTSYAEKFSDQRENSRATCVCADETGFWFGSTAGLHFLNPQTGELVNRFCPLNPESVNSPAAWEIVRDFLKRRVALKARREKSPNSPHPLQPASRVAGRVLDVVSDGNFLWLVTASANDRFAAARVLLFHKPTNQWVGSFEVDQATCLALDDKYLWFDGKSAGGNGAKCLQRIEKRQLYSVPKNQWTSDNVSEAETRAIYESLNDRERALWHFDGGEYETAASFLNKIEPPTSESLFLLGLCYDTDGLNDPEKSRAYFQRITAEHSDEPLAKDAERQLLPPAQRSRYNPHLFVPGKSPASDPPK